MSFQKSLQLGAVLLAAYLVCPSILPLQGAEPLTATVKRPLEQEAAKGVDAGLMQSVDKNTPVPAVVDDATFLRRIYFDLAGKPPSQDEILNFTGDRDPEKRRKQIDRLLTSEDYAINWGRYWRDVVTYHTPASANYLRWQLFDNWLVDNVRRNRPFNEIVTAMVTATGVNDECAPVNYLTAQFGNPVEIAATTSRVFLGVQLQCAQCHDSKLDSWKREQFHELVAFFGRAKLIQHKDVSGRGTPYAIEGREDGQYLMSDLNDPNRLIPMKPRFLTGEEISAAAGDAERRAALARFITSPKNPRFARAYVNRIWTSLMGWGFYPTVNDLGSGQSPQYGAVLDRLAQEWIASGYDMRWLFRTLAQTETYQRGLQPLPSSSAGAGPAVCPSRLRPEQIFDALARVLGFNENDKTIPAPAPNSAPAVARHNGLRHMVYQAFRVDPSMPVEEVQGTIPQALLLMNSAVVNLSIAANGKTYLADALAKGKSDEEILVAFYERILARKPKPEELETCRGYLKRIGDRKEALEDVYWSLVNSTEFLSKR